MSTTKEARLTDRPDVEQLRYSARHRSVLITNDVKWDFVALAASTPHAGVLFCNGGGRFPRDVLRRCLALWTAASQAVSISPDADGCAPADLCGSTVAGHVVTGMTSAAV